MEVVARVIHALLEVAVQPPKPELFELDTPNDWVAGFAPPLVALNVRDTGDTSSAGGAALIIALTGTFAGDPLAPEELTENDPLLVPVPSVAMATCT